MSDSFLSSILDFLNSYKAGLQELLNRCSNDCSSLEELLNSGELFEISEKLDEYFIQFWALVPGNYRAQIEKVVANQLSDPRRYQRAEVAKIALETIQRAAAVPVSMETLQTTNATLVFFESAFILSELLTRYESSLNSNAFLDRLKIHKDRNPVTEISRLARYIQNHVVLMVRNRPYRIIEVEAYLNSPTHPDPFAHCAPEQETSCRWYVHKRGGSCLEGPRKGIDLTFGEAESHFGGFLIRAISAIDETGHYVDGPSRCVDEILDTLGLGSATELNALASKAVTKAESPDLYVYSTPTLPFGEWCAAPRVGLTLVQDNLPQRLAYVGRFYRFHICPDQTKIEATLFFLSLLTQGWPGGQARLLMNMKEFQCRRAIDSFLAGADKSPDQFIGMARMNESDRCELIGAISRPGTRQLIEASDLNAEEEDHPHFSEFENAG